MAAGHPQGLGAGQGAPPYQPEPGGGLVCVRVMFAYTLGPGPAGSGTDRWTDSSALAGGHLLVVRWPRHRAGDPQRARPWLHHPPALGRATVGRRVLSGAGQGCWAQAGGSAAGAAAFRGGPFRRLWGGAEGLELCFLPSPVLPITLPTPHHQCRPRRVGRGPRSS